MSKKPDNIPRCKGNCHTWYWHWCPLQREMVNTDRIPKKNDKTMYPYWDGVKGFHSSYKPYGFDKDGNTRPRTGGGCLGFYPMEDRLTEWKEDLPMGVIKMRMYLEKSLRRVYHPDRKMKAQLKRKWDKLIKDSDK